MVLSQAWSLLLVTLGAACLPGMSRFVRLPAVVLEILFGVILGKSILELQLGGEWLPFLAELGFLLLMFQAGMEINVATLQQQTKVAVLVQILVFAATLGLAIMAARFLNQGLFLGLVLSTTSIGLVLPTLKEAGVSRTHLGQSGLIAASLADFLTLFGITFYLLFHQHGLSWDFLRPVPLFLGFGVLLKIARLWTWWHPEKSQRLLAALDTQELGVRISLALLFLFVALSKLVHVEPVLGAFMGGAMLSLLFRQKMHLEMKLSGIGSGFLIPLFFIHVGMEFDVKNLISMESLGFTAWLFLSAVLVKVIPSLLFVCNRISLKDSVRLGVLLCSRLSLIIVAATIGLKTGFITQELKDTIILLALITCLIGPTGFKLISPSEKTSKKDEPKIRRRKMPAGWMR
jgi:Kef-type K+ transport system membrane component KefB